MIINNIPFNVDLMTILTELKSQLNINDISLLSIMKNTSNDIMVQCPYHSNGQERKPSAGIRKSDGQFHCFACGETHSLQEVISHCFGWDDLFGVKGWQWLLKNFAVVSIEERKPIDIDLGRNNKQVKLDNYVSEEELDSYRYYHPYMWTRKLTPNVVDIFDIGYDKNTKCLTFPQRDIKGNTLFIARRSVINKYFNYPENVEKPIYGLYELNQVYKKDEKLIDEVIVCESMLDALYFWTIEKYAVALNGLGTPQQFKTLQSLRCRKLILCTDNDEKGLKARKTIRKNIKNKLITEYILPQGKKDANDCTLEELKNLKEVFI